MAIPIKRRKTFRRFFPKFKYFVVECEILDFLYTNSVYVFHDFSLMNGKDQHAYNVSSLFPIVKLTINEITSTFALCQHESVVHMSHMLFLKSIFSDNYISNSKMTELIFLLSERF